MNILEHEENLEEAGLSRQAARAILSAMTERDDALMTKRDGQLLEVALRSDMERMEASIRSNMEKMETSLRADMEKMEARLLKSISDARLHMILFVAAVVALSKALDYFI